MSAAAPWRVWTALGLVYVVWGSTYLAILYVVQGGLPPLLTASARFLLAATLLGGYLLARRGPGAFRATRGQLARATGVGLLLLLGGNGGVTLAEDADLPSGLTALLIAAVPLWVVLLRAGTGDRPSARTLLGVLVGLVGLALLLLPGARPEGVAAGPVLLVLGSSLAWALGSWTSSRADLPPDQLLGTCVQMLGGGLGLALAGLLRGETPDVSGAQPSAVLAFGYLVVFGSLVAFTAYTWVLRAAPVSTVSTYAYVNPVVAVLLGAAFVDEQLTVLSALGGAVTVLAVAVVVTEQTRAPAVPVDAPVDLSSRAPGR